MAEGAVIRPVDKGFRIEQVFIVPNGQCSCIIHEKDFCLSVYLISVLYMDYEHVIQIACRQMLT